MEQVSLPLTEVLSRMLSHSQQSRLPDLKSAMEALFEAARPLLAHGLGHLPLSKACDKAGHSGPTKVGRYWIVAKHGEASTASSECYLGQLDGSEAPEAYVYVIRPEVWRTDQFQQQWQALAAWAQASHPFNVPVLDWGVQKETGYLVIPKSPRTFRKDGVELKHRFKPRGLRTAMDDCLRPMVRGLIPIHARGEVYCKLTPANFLRDGGLLPGCIARSEAEYQAPEQAGGVADARADQFALAVVVLEALTACPPRLLPKRELEGSCRVVIFPDAMHDCLAAQVLEVLDRMLQYQPSRRYPSVQEAGDALYRALDESRVEMVLARS